MKNCILVHNNNGKPFIVRMVLLGDGMGRWDSSTSSWMRKHDSSTPLLAFFDPKYRETPYGQFTGASYYLSTILEREPGKGLLLDGGNPEWSLDADAMKVVVSWASQFVDEEQKRQLYAVTGRLAGDDDDTLFIVEAKDADDSYEKGLELLAEQRNISERDFKYDAQMRATGGKTELIMTNTERVVTEYGFNPEFSISKSPFQPRANETESNLEPKFPRQRT